MNKKIIQRKLDRIIIIATDEYGVLAQTYAAHPLMDDLADIISLAKTAHKELMSKTGDKNDKENTGK